MFGGGLLVEHMHFLGAFASCVLVQLVKVIVVVEIQT